MYIPWITRKLYPRKGGGGGGKSGGESSGGKGGESSSDGASGSTSGGAKSQTGVSGLQDGKNTITAYGNGGGKVSTISSGLFTGRTVGGGTRDQVYGNSRYGSGYPGVSTAGVSGRGFPFYFWPLAWGSLGYGATNLYTEEYGKPDNTSRPGGPMFESTFISSSSQNTTFYVVADNTTVISLVSSIQANCSSLFLNSTSLTTPVPFNSSNSSFPQPEQAVQYYRASSVALLLQGYNNTADWTDSQNQTDTPLPSNIDTNLLACLNGTIGTAVPLVDGAVGVKLTSGFSATMCLVWVFWCFSMLVL